MNFRIVSEIAAPVILILTGLLFVCLTPGTAVAQGCPDGFEPNDTLGGPGWSINGGPLVSYICSAGDVDYFRITGVGIGHTIEVDLTDLPKDYDLTLYRPDLSQAAQSDNAGMSAEKIRFTADASGDWHVRVTGKGQFDATRPYVIVANLFACGRDRLETNDTADQATSLGHPTVTRTESNLNLCPPGDQDWFSLDLGKTERLIADLTHDPNEGPVSLCLVEPDKTTLRSCTNGILSTERIDVVVPKAGRYYLRTQATTQAGINPNYTVAATVQLAPPMPVPCPRDVNEPNNGNSNPTWTGLCPTCAGTQYARFFLTLCRGDEDWYEIVLNQGESLDAWIRFRHDDGDLDLELYEGRGGSPVVKSNSGTNDEYVFFRAQRDNTDLLLRVFSKDPNGSNRYDLDLRKTGAPPTFTPTWTGVPTPTATPIVVCPPSDTKVDLSLHEIEITQSIQNLTQSVPLVGLKTTYARLFVKADRDIFLPSRATAHLRAVDAIGTPALPATARCHGYLQYIKRRGTDLLWERSRPPRIGLSCRLPYTWTLQGRRLRITGHVDTPAGYCDPVGDNDETSVVVDFAGHIHVFVQAVQVRDGCNDPSCGPSYADYKDLHLLAERMWPTSQVTLIPHTGSVQWQQNDDTLIALLERWKQYTNASNLKLPGQTKENTVVAGMRKPFSGTDPHGFAKGGSFWNTTDDPIAFTHEFGHSAGDLGHVQGCMGNGNGNGNGKLEPYPYNTEKLGSGGPRGFWGFDSGFTSTFPGVFDPNTHADIMSYCRPAWVSDYSYKRFARNQSSTFPTTAFASPVRASFAESAYIRLVGTVDTATDEVVLLPLRFVDEEEETEGDDFFDDYSAASIDISGNILDERSFVPNAIHDSLTTRAGFIVDLPADPGIAGVVILRNGIEIFARHASPSAPTIEVDPVVGMVGDLLTVHWDAADDDGDPVFVSVELSTDGGDSWSPLSIDLNGTSTVYDTTLWAGTDGGYLRFHARDDFHETSVDVGPFSVEPKGPVVFVLRPGDGTELQLGEPLTLRASGFDPEQGVFDRDSFAWFSSVDGLLGNGEELPVEDLTPGWHEITVEVTDADGGIGSDAIQLCASNFLCEHEPGECPTTGFAPDGDEDGVCDEIDVCPDEADPGQGDADGDGLGDACDPCTDGATATGTDIRLTINPGQRDGLHYDTTLEFDTPPEIDPAATGLSLSVRDSSGEAILDLLLPPGGEDPDLGGWSTSPTGLRRSYRSSRTTDGPVVRAVVRSHPNQTNVIKLSITARGDFGLPGIPLTPSAIVNFTPGVGASGLCAETTPGGGCYLNEFGELICP